ncbi:MAG TPA: hypothetical protein VFQ23_02685 [Anaerolineales bacterium]|nr:hypothetical protein [Anaerolineales bacterium]
MKKLNNRLIVVLGMHRSGTSVITRGLQVLGVELGDNLMPAYEGNNSKGFWEDVDINALNIEMLRFLKIDWHFVTPVQASDVDALCQNGYLQRAVDLLRKKTASRKVFGFKDPRVAKLFPFWKEVFTQGQMNVDYILVIRHPLSVCHSLSKRDGFDFEKSYLLWLEHVIGSLVGTEGETRVIVDYDTFMQTPETELTRIAKRLQLSMNADDFRNFQLEFLDRGLQHTVYQLEDLTHDSAVPPLVQEVYSSLLQVTAGNAVPGEPALRDKIEHWGLEFSRMRSTLAFVDKLGLKISAMTAERTGLVAERKALLQEKTEWTQAFMVKEQTVQRLRAELGAIHQSRWWRWTQPLRNLFKRPEPPK